MIGKFCLPLHFSSWVMYTSIMNNWDMSLKSLSINYEGCWFEWEHAGRHILWIWLRSCTPASLRYHPSESNPASVVCWLNSCKKTPASNPAHLCDLRKEPSSPGPVSHLRLLNRSDQHGGENLLPWCVATHLAVTAIMDGESYFMITETCFPSSL